MNNYYMTLRTLYNQRERKDGGTWWVPNKVSMAKLPKDDRLLSSAFFGSKNEENSNNRKDYPAGCAPWMRVGGLYESKADNFSVELPEGWMRKGMARYLLVTTDGVLLQNIVIEWTNVDEELGHTKKKFKKGMLAQELIQVVTDSISSNMDFYQVNGSTRFAIWRHRGSILIRTWKLLRRYLRVLR